MRIPPIPPIAGMQTLVTKKLNQLDGKRQLDPDRRSGNLLHPNS
ncbi:hypothetical protein [Paenibacillus daejeonensis]|nr:hypothetical protein [Paenibacillus daejeonensis]